MSESNTSLSSNGPNNKLRNPNAQLQSINGIMRQAAAGRPSSAAAPAAPAAAAAADCQAGPVQMQMHYHIGINSGASLSGPEDDWQTNRLPQPSKLPATCRMPHATVHRAASGYPACHLMRELPPMPMSTSPSIMLSALRSPACCTHCTTVGGGRKASMHLQLGLTFCLALIYDASKRTMILNPFVDSPCVSSFLFTDVFKYI